MAGHRAERGGARAESIGDFMERRRLELERFGREAEAAGHAALGVAARTGQDIAAATSHDVRVLGAQVLETQKARPEGAGKPAPTAAQSQAPTASYGAIQSYRASPDEMTGVRRQQAEFARSQRVVDRENSWMAVPALAPVATVLALEGGAAMAARLAGQQIKRAPLQLVERDPYLRVGDNWATRAGRRAHQELRERLEQKPGWKYEPNMKTADGRILKPDAGAPVRNRNPLNPESRYQMELKPNTPSGRRAGERAAKRYQAETGNKTRPIYYDPKSFI